MKKIIIIACVLGVTYSQLRAHKPSHTLELKSSYFFFAQDPLNKVYNHGGFEESLSGSFPLWRWLNAYASVGIAHVSGKSLNNCQKTSLFLVPLDLGLKVVFPLHKKLDFYLTVGGQYSYLQQHNDSSFVDKHLHQHCGGFFINGGWNIFATRHLLIGFFGEFAGAKTSIKSHKPNVFGNHDLRIDNGAVGVSIGYAF